MNKPKTKVAVETKTADDKKIPTWVPDWLSFQSFILSEPVNAHHPYGHLSPKLEIFRDHPMLKTHGVKIDTIKRCSRSLKNKDSTQSQPTKRMSRP
jgi:hypothetical protein